MRVLRIVLRRLAGAVPLLLLLLLLTVALQAVTPGDPARAIAGPRASDEVLAAIRVQYRLDDGIVQQFGSAVSRAVRGDLGTSNRLNIPVTDLLGQRAPQTLWLAGAGVVGSVLIAVPVAVWAGTRGRRLRAFADQLSLVSSSVPSYWLGLVVILVFAIKLGWFDVGGAGDGLLDRLHHLVLPSLVIAAAIVPVLLRSLTESVARVMHADHIVTARAAGLGGRRLIRRHVLRNALPPMVTLLGLQAGGVLFGLVVVERTFGINGLGTLLFDSVRQRDFPVVQGLTLVLGLCVVLANLLADAVVAVLDPRWHL